MNYTFRPHYHALFYLASTIDPRDFTETCRKIWQGLNHSKDPKQISIWKYGNLGFMLPFKRECDYFDAAGHNTEHQMSSKFHDYLCADMSKAALYCAKYASKQVGFFQRKLVRQIIEDGLRPLYKDNMPRCVMSRGFGMNILKDKTFDPVKRTVLNPLLNKVVPVPNRVMENYAYKRYFDGDYRLKRETKVHYTKDGTPYITKDVVLRKDGQPCVYKYMKRAKTLDGILCEVQSLPDVIEKKTTDIMALGYSESTSVKAAIWFIVYDLLPYDIWNYVTDRYKTNDEMSLFRKVVYSDIYLRTKLMRCVVDIQPLHHTFTGVHDLLDIFDQETVVNIERIRYQLQQIHLEAVVERADKDRKKEEFKKLYVNPDHLANINTKNLDITKNSYSFALETLN